MSTPSLSLLIPIIVRPNSALVVCPSSTFVTVFEPGMPLCPSDCPARSSVWTCPLCCGSFEHSRSFKVHIRRLSQQCSRPKCCLNPRDIHHCLLVARFAGADFHSKAANFCAHFYAFVARAISPSRSVEVSSRLVAEWLDAAKCADGRALPEC